eukprot:c15035_g1_i1.p1 GENE.c15035_g1_i1~~c15035_g1_i1.p1  ORF type:complete len:371 (-),score=48.15 c15035_g1_i1:465-1577(-)
MFRQKRTLSRALKYSEINTEYFDPSSGIVKSYLTFVDCALAQQEKIVVIGAGLAGLVSAMLLAARGFKVTVVEGGDDYDAEAPPQLDDSMSESEASTTGQEDADVSWANRSEDDHRRRLHQYAVVLTPRATTILEKIGVDPSVWTALTHNTTRVLWNTFKRKVAHQQLVSVYKADLLKALLKLARTKHHDTIKFRFRTRFLSIRLKSPSQPRHEAVLARLVEGSKTTKEFSVPFGLLLGCDGVMSSVRAALAAYQTPGHMFVRLTPLPVTCSSFEAPNAPYTFDPYSVWWHEHRGSVLRVVPCHPVPVQTENDGVAPPTPPRFVAMLFQPEAVSAAPTPKAKRRAGAGPRVSTRRTRLESRVWLSRNVHG